MPQLSEVVTFSKRRESRKGRIVPWEEFEPLLNQLRQAADCNQDYAMRLIGYGGGTMINAWRKEVGVPILAINSIKWVLHDLKIDPSRPEPIKQFSYSDLLIILSALARDHENNRSLISHVAKEIAKYD